VLLIDCTGFIIAQQKSETGVEQLYREAQAARAAGDLPRAEQRYAEAIRRAPGQANVYHNLGIIYFREGKYHEAAEALEKATALSPRSSASWVMLGLAYYQLYDSAKAISALQSALRLNPNDANALLFLGKSQFQMQDYRSAAESFEKLLRSKPSDPNALYLVSLSHMKRMIETLDQLGDVAAESYQFRLLTAKDAESHNNDAAAITNYQEALRLEPGGAGLHYSLGNVYARMGQYDKAVGEFKKELAINAEDPLALWKLGELTLSSNPQEARACLEHGLRLLPDFPQAVLAYGRVLALMGDTQEALVQFQRVVRLAPEEDSVHYHLANVYRRLGRLEEAKLEMAKFQQLAQQRAERDQKIARQLIRFGRAEQQGREEPVSLFFQSRDPVHP
jgi:tetratricopeptide (TPR) repeat protein